MEEEEEEEKKKGKEVEGKRRRKKNANNNNNNNNNNKIECLMEDKKKRGTANPHLPSITECTHRHISRRVASPLVTKVPLVQY